MKSHAEKSLSCFLSVSRAIAGETEVNRVLERFADELAALLPHDHLDIVMLGAHGQKACYEVGRHTTRSRRSDPNMLTRNSPIRSLLWGEAPNMLTDDAWADDRFHFPGADDYPIYAARLRSRVIVALRVRGAIIGSLAISRQQVGVYDKRSLRIAQDAADLLAPCLFALEQGEQARKAAVAESDARASQEMLRLGALRLTEGMEQERQRIAMDIHDRTLADLARLSRRLARMVSLYRIVQEATNNAARHAAARCVEVQVTTDAGMIEIRIADDGAGIGARGEAASGGLGHMRTRATLISAELAVICGGPDGGTTIVVRLPVGPVGEVHRDAEAAMRVAGITAEDAR
jgi:hypothetical protein